jgi:phenylalanyl-tRNA synthetase beta chain
MDVPLEWMQDYVDLGDLSLAEISVALQLSGLSLTTKQPIAGKHTQESQSELQYFAQASKGRQDWCSTLGIAREMAARLDRPLNWREPRPPRDPQLTSTKDLRIKFQNDEECNRLVVLRISDVNTLPSPPWMVERLIAAGIRPSNLIVDAAYFVMLEFHQWVHVIDEDRLRGASLEVKRAGVSKGMKTASGEIIQLEAADLVMSDGEGPVSLVGLPGLETTLVDLTTSRIIVVCAALNPSPLRKTAERFDHTTKTTLRFVTGTDLTMLPYAALRVAEIIAQGTETARLRDPDLPSAKVAKDIFDIGIRPSSPRLIALRLSHAKEFLGMAHLTRSHVSQNLGRFSFRLVDGTDERLVFEIPSFRPDIEREIDLIAELSRILGVEHIPLKPLSTLGKTKNI